MNISWHQRIVRPDGFLCRPQVLQGKRVLLPRMVPIWAKARARQAIAGGLLFQPRRETASGGTAHGRNRRSGTQIDWRQAQSRQRRSDFGGCRSRADRGRLCRFLDRGGGAACARRQADHLSLVAEQGCPAARSLPAPEARRPSRYRKPGGGSRRLPDQSVHALARDIVGQCLQVADRRGPIG